MMATRIINPEDMFTIMEEDRDRFDVKMHSNLCIPSFMHAYSMGVEFAREWFLSKLPKGFLRTAAGKDNIHVNEKNVFDDYRRLTKAERLKRVRPFLTITPQINFDFDLDTVHMYNYGADLLATRGWQQDSFFRDGEKGLYLLMNMQLVEISCGFKMYTSSKAEQIDLFKKMEIWFRIGGTETQDRDMDFHIPDDIMYMVAKAAGFCVNDENKNICDPVAFSRYMNAHSAFPVLYKFRKVSHKFAFFLRLPMLSIHINIMDKLQPDTGNTQGQLRTDYGIEMAAVFRYPAPQFYVFYSKDPKYCTIERHEHCTRDSDCIDLTTYKVVDIPIVNNRGWEKYVWSKYEYDYDDNGCIDLCGMIGHDSEESEFYRVLNKCKNLGLSPGVYLDVVVFSADPMEEDVVHTTVNWNDMKIIIHDDLIPQVLYLVIYVDLEYYNNSLIEEDSMYSNRMAEHKDHNSKAMNYNPEIQGDIRK